MGAECAVFRIIFTQPFKVFGTFSLEQLCPPVFDPEGSDPEWASGLSLE